MNTPHTPTPHTFPTGGRPPLHVFKRLLGFLAPFKSQLTAAVLLGALAIGSSIGLLTTSAFLISAAALQPSIAELSVAIVGVRFFGIARGVFRYLERLAAHALTFRLLARLRVWFYETVEPLAPAGLTQHRSGDLLGRVIADVDTLENFYVRAVGPPLVAVVVTLGMMAFLGSVAGRLALALLLFLLLGGLGLPWLVRRTSTRPGRALIHHRAQLNTALVDAIQGMADLQAYGQEDAILADVSRLGGDLAAQQRRMAWIAGLHEGLGALLGNSAMWAILWLAIPLVSAGQIGGVHLAGLALGTLAAFEAVQPLPAAAQHLEESVQAARRLFQLADARPAVTDPPDPASPPATPALAVRDLRFRYGPADLPALDGISFDLPAGARIAIVGPSGAGKSTIANLLLRFWEYQGSIRLDGRELREYAQADVRATIGVVGQDTHLFNASVRDNLRLARPGADQTAIEEAARQARLHDFITTLPQSYDTRIGERGLQLSGGQRQRLALARALLRDTPLLLLDEPTANLDPITERHILDTVHGVTAGRTLLLITHRLVAMERMDEILVLDHGRIVARGRHDRLRQADGLYGRLWALQNRALLPGRG